MRRKRSLSVFSRLSEFTRLYPLLQTYTVDRQTPDSAGTATAIMSGVKTNYKTIGLDPSAEVNDCEGSESKRINSMLDWAMESGKEHK